VGELTNKEYLIRSFIHDLDRMTGEEMDRVIGLIDAFPEDMKGSELLEAPSLEELEAPEAPEAPEGNLSDSSPLKIENH
jgi:hypothetical protein